MTEAGSPPETDSLEALLEQAARFEVPPGDLSVAIAREYRQAGDLDQAFRWTCRVVESGHEYRWWDAASRILTKITQQHTPPANRSIRLAVTGSYTTDQLVGLVRLTNAARGIDTTIFQAGYGQYQQELLNPASDLYAFEPDYVLLATHADELHFPSHTKNPDSVVQTELSRWEKLWEAVQSNSSARLVQTNFVSKPHSSFGNLSTRLPGSRASLVANFNQRLGEAAGTRIALVDAEATAARVGKENWFDDRYWHRSKQAVGLEVLPHLAEQVTAVLSAELGLTRKCLIIDLDNTVWGGVIGEDGMSGIQIGHGPVGESFTAFQEHLLELKETGTILAVCSKNDEATAREPFETHPDMRLGLSDVAAFYANWRPKPENIREIAESLDLGLDSMVFVDDQPAERESVRKALPEVDVIVLPQDPALYSNALAAYPYFETAAFTDEDTRRTETYRARREAHELKESSGSLDEFLADLDMSAEIEPVDSMTIDRVSQLIGKTNQFNLTTRRHTQTEVEEMVEGAGHVCLYAKLTDRFTDHGLVGVVIGAVNDESMEIDTLVMSCRVIGRTLEEAMVKQLAEHARARGVERLVGVYIPTKRNGLVKDLYETLGFKAAGEREDGTVWEAIIDDLDLETPHVSTEAK